MCHDWWERRARRHEDRFDEELRYLLDERQRPEPAAPVAEREHDEDRPESVRPAVEAATRA